MMNRKLSWKPDIPDIRDYPFSKLSGVTYSAIGLPKAINLRRWCSEVEDQQNIGSCTANAIVGMLEFNLCYRKLPYQNLSRLFLYYNERVLGENVTVDSGAYLRDGVKTLALNGVCSAGEWPYDLRKWKTQPPIRCYQNSLVNRISSYYRLDTLDEMKTALANAHPFVFGFAVYESFMSAAVANTGTVPMPATTEKMLGGHAVMVMGYDDESQRFLVRNSWGKNWGIKDGNLQGYFTMPYEYLTNRNLSDDFWTVIK
jgi:C1A family cysteine protease